MWTRGGVLALAWVALLAQGEEQRLSDKVRLILEHYKKEDPVGIPGLNIQDPFPAPDLTKIIGIYSIAMKEINVYGVSQFRVRYVDTDLARMEVFAGVQIDAMHIEGRYTVRYFFSRSQGKFNISLQDVYTHGMVKMIVGRNGKLQADSIDMDISFSKMQMNLENPSLSDIVKTIISSMAPYIFDAIKPYILKEKNQEVRTDINKKLVELPHKFPNSIQPLDYMFSDARRLVEFMKYDPYKVQEYNYTMGMTSIELNNIWLMGLATFYRVGNITVGFEKHVMHTSFQVGTLSLGGRCHWKVSTLLGYLSRAGAAQFTVDYLQVNIRISQPLDTRKHPKLEEFDVKLGDFEIRVDGTGTLDYVIELVANALPNLLRYQIMNAIETNVRAGLQEALNRVDMEDLIEEKLQQLDQMTEE